ncbi:MAG TPA: 3D-(3,5/4)-trihydroxycyclohexane-1,2-dione acylhydrolase (decyclizing) [Acidimicrobiia bacterium]|nr:3D-(3,5/4)-trihydroxycyclohexane-1,2-dione acylhydrolase (decyclizing) [Acidimicrobiia bacterium]
METVRLTTAQAIVRYLVAQRVADGGTDLPLFAGVFAIFGHGNVTCLGEALEKEKDRLPTWRGQNEQTMAMAAVAFAKARRRRQIMVATSSIGPGATNMVTAAGIALANRLPLLMLSGDTFASRLPDPVLQQVEHFGDPTLTVNDAFKAVCRYWDRITHPAQIINSLPRAVATMLDPGGCGPAFLGLSQDIQGEAFDYPLAFFAERTHTMRRPGPDPSELAAAAAVLRSSTRPLVIAGGGVHYSGAVESLRRFAEDCRLPVVETVAGKSSLRWDHPNLAGPIGVTGSTSANELAADADVVLAVGTRMQDFTTGSWSVFRNPALRLVMLNVAPHDAAKHLAVPLVADAGRGLDELAGALADWQAPAEWLGRGQDLYRTWNAYLDEAAEPPTPGVPPSYQAVIRVINDHVGAGDYVVAAAGGLPGELNKGWRSVGVGTFDCEYGFSCMGYEIGGAWGAAMAKAAEGSGTVISFCGDGSYLMANSELYSSVLSGHPFVLVLCDNGGFAVIDRLQTFKGSASFNNMLEDTRHRELVRVDFAKHAAALGAWVEEVASLDALPEALARAMDAGRTAVLLVATDPHRWTGGDAWWDVGVPEVSDREEVLVAKGEHEAERKHQRIGV